MQENDYLSELCKLIPSLRYTKLTDCSPKGVLNWLVEQKYLRNEAEEVSNLQKEYFYG